MKKIAIFATLLGMFLIPLAFSAPKDTDSQFINKDVQSNILDNPGFEFGAHNWNLVGIASTFSVTANASTVGIGGRSGAFSGGVNEHLDTDLFTIPNMLKGRQCMAQLAYQWSTGAVGNYDLKVLNHAGATLVSLGLRNSTAWQESFVPFKCPSSGSLKLRLSGNSPAKPTVFLDNAYLGAAKEGLIVSRETNQWRMGAARINGSGGSASNVLIEYGDWIQSTDQGAAGIMDITIKEGYFGEAPLCVCSTGDGDSFGSMCVIEGTGSGGVDPTKTNLSYRTWAYATGLAGVDSFVLCIGPPGS